MTENQPNRTVLNTRYGRVLVGASISLLSSQVGLAHAGVSVRGLSTAFAVVILWAYGFSLAIPPVYEELAELKESLA